MSSFKLQSPYQPMGDQPQAIEELIAGLKQGQRYQTLLGATGTGKSLAWDEPALIRTLTSEGSARIELRPIGPLVDEILARARSTVEDQSGTEIGSPNGVEALSFNPRTGATEWRAVTAVSRHAAPAMFRVQTACGRQVVVTGDHNFLSLHGGELGLRETKDLDKGHYLPLPLSFALPSEELESIDLLDLFRDDPRIEIHCPWLIEWAIEQVGWPKVRTALGRHYPNVHCKRHSIAHGPKWRGIPVPIAHAILSELQLQIPSDRDVMIRAIRMPRRLQGLPRWLHMTDELLTFLGLMLAEGFCSERYAVLAAYESPVRDEFIRCAESLGIKLSVRESSDFVFGSQLWVSLLSQLVGPKSHSKHLPPFWPSLSARQLGVLIRAYAEGDGGVDGAMISVSTKSRRLASELGYAFFGMGIWSRLHRKWKRATNSAHAGDWYQEVTLSGQSNLRLFDERIGFITDRKNEALRGLLRVSENTNVDVVPVPSQRLRSARLAAGLTMKSVGRSAGICRSAVTLIEQGDRRPSRNNLNEILDGLELLAPPSDNLEQLLSEVRPLTRAHWTPVSEVVPIEYAHPHVYDFTVAENETFFAGHGGLFVHNTFSIANVIAAWGRPTLVISHNKTLAAQLYGEFRQFFPENGVGYFISYYDYYQPEAYVPSTNTYIAKDATVNDDIDRLRLQATSMLLERDDVIIVASVSSIYGLGAPEDWKGMRVDAEAGARMRRQDLLEKMVAIQYTRNDVAPERGTFRVRGDVIEVHPAYESHLVRIELDDDVVARLSAVDPVTGQVLRRMDRLALYPAKHFVTPEPRRMAALSSIREELRERLDVLRAENKLLEAQRLKQRTDYDLEMLATIGTCPGVENYSRHLSGRAPGERPGCLLDYFPKDFLLIVDESHVTIPQVGAMYEGDRSRKQTLVEFGFRLPSALDNRPLRFDEFEAQVGPTLYVSATPGNFEMERCHGVFVEQVIRPTGLIDPEMIIRPIGGQVDDLIGEIRATTARNERTLVTTLTKRMAEDLTDYLGEAGIKVRYLHSDVDALSRVDILRGLRLGEFDVLVGINLLREGLDLPEVSLVAILDADKEGFLRSERSLIQTAGRAARNVGGRVIMYADVMTDSMKRAISETDRRRRKQLAWNLEHGITPRTIVKSVEEIMRATSVADSMRSEEKDQLRGLLAAVESEGADALLMRLEGEMLEAARALEFERAASLRDRIDEVRSTLAMAGVLGVGTTDAPPRGTGRGQSRGKSGSGHRGGRR